MRAKQKGFSVDTKLMRARHSASHSGKLPAPHASVTSVAVLSDGMLLSNSSTSRGYIRTRMSCDCI